MKTEDTKHIFLVRDLRFSQWCFWAFRSSWCDSVSLNCCLSFRRNVSPWSSVVDGTN